jgi:hypothetical protein
MKVSYRKIKAKIVFCFLDRAFFNYEEKIILNCNFTLDFSWHSRDQYNFKLFFTIYYNFT